MNTMPGQRAWKRQLPKWLKITLSVFAVLFVLGAIFGKAPGGTTPAPVAAPLTTASSTPPPTTSVTTTTPPADTYTVTGVVSGDTVKVTSGGVEKLVHVLGIRTAVANGSGCFGAETLTWATSTLVGKQVKLGQTALDQAGNTVASLTLPDGGDYSAVALQAGYAIADGAASTALQTAQSAARSGSTGLWGPPCNGNIDTPAQIDVKAPDVPKPDPTTTKAKTSTPKTTTKKASPVFANCDAAKAAGVAPLHRGEPGYSTKLDRDGDGVACE
jgi:endonuclease YncB( thermonuclease family)